MVAVGVLGAGLGLVAAAFALFLFAHACEGSDVATAPRGGTLGNAVCASGVYVWNPLLWLAVGVLAIVAIPAALAAAQRASDGARVARWARRCGPVDRSEQDRRRRQRFGLMADDYLDLSAAR